MISSVMYRLISFADYSNLNYTADNLSCLVKAFDGRDYSFSQLFESNLMGSIYQGFYCNSSQGFPTISIGSQRIEIGKASNKISGFDLDEITGLKKQMIDSVSILLDAFSAKIQDANRIALVVNFAYFDIDDTKKVEFKNRFLNQLDYYKEKSTTEFVAKYAGLDNIILNGVNERINVISTISRLFPGQGPGFVTSVDGYGLEVDINTVADNKKNRFSFESFGPFVASADSISNTLSGEILNGCL